MPCSPPSAMMPFQALLMGDNGLPPSPPASAHPLFVVAAQDVIEAFEVTGRRVLREVLGMSWDEVLVTDESDLSDFSTCGMPEDDFPEGANYGECCRLWNAWVIARISALYRVRLADTRIRLVELFRQVENSTNNPLLN